MTLPFARRLSAASIVIVIGATACASSGGGASPADTGPTIAQTVTVGPGGSMSFLPVTVTIRKGETVAWTWDEGAHSVTSGSGCTPDGAWDTGVQMAPFTFTRTFDAVGSYPYFCTPHCAAGMTGVVVVTP